MRRLVVGAACLSVGLAAGLATGYARWHDPYVPRYISTRSMNVEMAALAAPKGSPVIVGDSTAERIYSGDLCGGAFNAAVSWATTRQVTKIAQVVSSRIHPRLVIVAAGTNDFKNGAKPNDFRADYDQLLSAIGPARLVLVGLPSFPRGSAIIRDIAKARGAVYVPPVEGPDMTVDGIHENEKGVEEWRRRVSAACR